MCVPPRDLTLLQKRRRLGPRPVERDVQDGEPFRRVAPPRLPESGEFFNAGRAPRGPEVEQHVPALEIGGRDGTLRVLERLDLEAGHLLPNLGGPGLCPCRPR